MLHSLQTSAAVHISRSFVAQLCVLLPLTITGCLSELSLGVDLTTVNAEAATFLCTVFKGPPA